MRQKLKNWHVLAAVFGSLVSTERGKFRGMLYKYVGVAKDVKRNFLDPFRYFWGSMIAF